MQKIDSILIENRIFEPGETFRLKANISFADYEEMCEQAQNDYEGFWGDLARKHLDWAQPFTRVLNEDKAPFYRWFEDGKINVSFNCLDRHLHELSDKPAIIFESDEGTVTSVTYAELHRQVCIFANGLKSLGLVSSDRVIIYMPMSIEVIVAMQACARIGLIHSVVFGGFSAKSLSERIADARAKLVITADEGMRGGRAIPLKSTCDEALTHAEVESVEHVIVYRRTGGSCQFNAPRDIWWDDVIASQSPVCEAIALDAEHPLYILYTSGSTGKPKGVQHSSAGYLLGAILSMQWTFDYKPDDVFWCTADVGWVTGHTYVAYGPLAVGATQVMFEGTPTWPHSGRFWEMISRHRVTVFYTAPTAIRSLIKLGPDLPLTYDLKSLRLIGTVGEPINPEAWMWYYNKVGGGRCPVVDTWWQTETGSHMIAPLPGAISTKPGSCTRPLPGIMADVVNEKGQSVEDGSGGMLVIKRPFPSQLRTLWNDPERFCHVYFPKNFGGRWYLAGDSAHRDSDGYFWIMGRIDDVLNVSGHRLGTMEIESALVAHPFVAEAAVVGREHEIKGESIVAFVVLKGKMPDEAEADKMAIELSCWVTEQIGSIARPDEIRFGENLPKTRSGKIMRRLLRSIARREDIQSDISTLENPQILAQLSRASGNTIV